MKLFDLLKSALFVLALAVALPATAGECPDVPDRTAEKDRLHSQLLTVQIEMHGRAVADQLWMIWMIAPDETSQGLLDRGRERIRVADYERAEVFFTDLIEYCPHYAEGWNQRAYVHFLRQNHEAALEDIIKVLEIEPGHFGALAGRATALINMGRPEVGHKALRAALKINPWLSERHLLPPGEDI